MQIAIEHATEICWKPWLLHSHFQEQDQFLFAYYAFLEKNVQLKEVKYTYIYTYLYTSASPPPTANNQKEEKKNDWQHNELWAQTQKDSENGWKDL